MADFGFTSLSTISAKIISFEIPKTHASCVYISWKGDGFQGHTKFFHTCQRTIQLEYSFLFRASRAQSQCALIELHSKSIHGEITNLAGLSISVPTEIFDGKSSNSTFEIPTTNLGTFKITIAFNILPEDAILNPSFDIQDKPNVSKYSDLVNRLKPAILQPETPYTFWGPEGLRANLEHLSRCKTTDNALNELQNLTTPLHEVARAIDFYSQFVQKIILLLMDEPQFICESDCKMYYLTGNIDSSLHMYPVLAISICKLIEQYIGQKRDPMYLEMPVIEIAGSITQILSSPSITHSELINILSSSLFIITFLNIRYKAQYQTIFHAYKQIEQQSIAKIMSVITETIQSKTTLPNRIKAFIEKYKRYFQMLRIPSTIWDVMYSYFMQAIDFYASTHWISNSSELTINLNKYTDTFPEAEFPFMNSIAKVCADPTRYLHKKNNLKELSTISKHYLYQILLKANETQEKKLSDSQIERLVDNHPDSPSMINIDWFIQFNPVILNTFMKTEDIPPNLPNIPETK